MIDDSPVDADGTTKLPLAAKRGRSQHIDPHLVNFYEFAFTLCTQNPRGNP